MILRKDCISLMNICIVRGFEGVLVVVDIETEIPVSLGNLGCSILAARSIPEFKYYDVHEGDQKCLHQKPRVRAYHLSFCQGGIRAHSPLRLVFLEHINHKISGLLRNPVLADLLSASTVLRSIRDSLKLRA